MLIQDFCSLVAKLEGKKTQTSIGNIREVVKIINKLTGGALYAIIKLLPNK